MNNTKFFGQSTPVNQNRTGNNYLFGNTTAIPSSTPFSSSNLFGSTTILQPSLLENTTFHKYESITGLDKINKNDLQTSNHTKTSPNELHSKDHQKLSSSTSCSFLFDTKPSTSTAITFSVGNSQPSISTFTLGNSLSFFPNTTTTTTSTPFTFSSSSKLTTTSSTPPTVHTLFSTMNQPKTSPIDLQLFQTMVNTQPFNNELAFLARNIKPNVSRDRARLPTASNLSASRSSTNLFSSVLTKPSISISKSNKRKLDDSFLDDESLFSMDKISKINIKRPRMLDMNKIRSIVLGNNETLIIKSSSSENPIGWNQFSTYDEYISSKKQEIKHDQQLFRLPRLTHHDYYTKPTIEELHSYFNDQGQCFIKQFTIGRKHYGSVTFQGLHMNLAGLDLDRLVQIDHRQVTVYPNDEDRPNEGEELNCQAIISLIGVYPIDRSILNGGEEITDPDRLIEMNYRKYLEGMTKKFQGEFVDYDVYTGTWIFQVEHF